MPNIERVTGKIFAENASPVGNNPEIGKFGNAKQGIYTGEADVQEIQNSEAWSQGWAEAVVAAMNYPPLPEMNGVLKVLSYQICYLLQKGVPEWDSGTTYYTNDYVNYNGKLYYSTIDNNTTEPATSEGGNNWKSGTVDLPIATTSSIGAVQPDGVSIGVTEEGIITVLQNPIIDISHPIGDPILTLNNTLNANEIWLEGAKVLKSSYPLLANVYGDSYAPPGSSDTLTYLYLPDCRNRVFWGTDESTGFGYISAGLPNIEGSITFSQNGVYGLTGAFKTQNIGGGGGHTAASLPCIIAQLDASIFNEIYGNSDTVQPPSIKVRIKTRYK